MLYQHKTIREICSTKPNGLSTYWNIRVTQCLIVFIIQSVYFEHALQWIIFMVVLGHAQRYVNYGKVNFTDIKYHLHEKVSYQCFWLTPCLMIKTLTSTVPTHLLVTSANLLVTMQTYFIGLLWNRAIYTGKGGCILNMTYK